MIETYYNIPGAPHLALIADLHGKPYENIIESLQNRAPEIICIAGDIIYGICPEDDVSPLIAEKNVMPFLRACASIAPSFLSLGNHEWVLDKEDLELIGETGVTVLDNEWTEFESLAIGGLTSAFSTDQRRYLKELSPKERGDRRYLNRKLSAVERIPCTEWLDAFCDAPGYHILLCHHPEYYPRIPEGIDLILSGHAHGGQWRVFGRGIFAPGQGLFPKYTCGVYDGRLVVSRGLSNTTRVPRINNPTEIVYL